MILQKKCIFGGTDPLRFALENFQKRGSLINKQTIFFIFFTFKSYVLICVFTEGNMRKNYLLKSNSVTQPSKKRVFF